MAAALVRSFFAGDDVEAHIALRALPQSGEVGWRADTSDAAGSPMSDEPDRERRYTALAQSELGVHLAGEAAVDVNPLATLAHFIGQGILHIFTGYDHILFILTLLLAVGTWRRLAIIVTSFTAAHSITLVAATLGLVTLPSASSSRSSRCRCCWSPPTRCCGRGPTRARWSRSRSASCHGFGLSTVLRDLGLSGRQLVPALLGFNVGVEIGQLAIVGAVFPLILMLRAAAHLSAGAHGHVRVGRRGRAVLGRRRASAAR